MHRLPDDCHPLVAQGSPNAVQPVHCGPHGPGLCLHVLLWHHVCSKFLAAWICKQRNVRLAVRLPRFRCWSLMLDERASLVGTLWSHAYSRHDAAVFRQVSSGGVPSVPCSICVGRLRGIMDTLGCTPSPSILHSGPLVCPHRVLCCIDVLLLVRLYTCRGRYSCNNRILCGLSVLETESPFEKFSYQHCHDEHCLRPVCCPRQRSVSSQGSPDKIACAVFHAYLPVPPPHVGTSNFFGMGVERPQPLASMARCHLGSSPRLGVGDDEPI
mmetsp:Transcript_20381/g.56025  ORF Transcript_20381/g.56025 Transcript_20381/m.56025 type:complete len:270 (-) Transcript_20381:104-913(-)